MSVRPLSNRIGALIRRRVNTRDGQAEERLVRRLTAGSQLSIETGFKSNQSGLETF